MHSRCNGLVWTKDVLVSIDLLLQFVLLLSHLLELVLLLDYESVQISVAVLIVPAIDGVPTSISVLSDCNLTSLILLQRGLVMRLLTWIVRFVAEISKLLGDTPTAIWSILVHPPQKILRRQVSLACPVELLLNFNQVLAVRGFARRSNRLFCYSLSLSGGARRVFVSWSLQNTFIVISYNWS